MNFLDRVFQQPFAMDRASFNAFRASVATIPQAAIVPRADMAASGEEITVNGGVAIIDLCGVIFQEDTWMNRLICEYLGGCILGDFMDRLERAWDDDAIKSIAVRVNGPGGEAWGLDAASERIFTMRGKKPMVAHVENMNASAHYFLSSSFDGVYSTKDAFHGCIGTIASWMNYDGMMEQMGIKEIVITSECSPDKDPDDMTPEGLALYKQPINTLGWQFFDAVVRNRATDKKTVSADFGKGWILSSKDAVKVGMIDGIMSFGDVLGKLQAGKPMPQKKPAASGANSMDFNEFKAHMKTFFGAENSGTPPVGTPLVTPPPVAAMTISPEVQAKLDKLAVMEASEVTQRESRNATRAAEVKAVMASRIAPSALKSDVNPDGLDVDAVIGRAIAAGTDGDLMATYSAMTAHPVLSSVPMPKEPIAQHKAAEDPEAFNKAEYEESLNATPAGRRVLASQKAGAA